MPDVVECPQCHRQLRVPEDLIERQVKCPACATTFIAGAGPAPAERPVSDWVSRTPEAAVALPPAPAEDQADRDFFNRQRRDLSPHRGGTVLTLGILSLACLPIFGPFAWIMGNTDMAEIRAGRMDPMGEGTTNAGRICGIIGTAYGAFWLCCVGLQMMAVVLG